MRAYKTKKAAASKKKKAAKKRGKVAVVRRRRVVPTLEKKRRKKVGATAAAKKSARRKPVKKTTAKKAVARKSTAATKKRKPIKLAVPKKKTSGTRTKATKARKRSASAEAKRLRATLRKTTKEIKSQLARLKKEADAARYRADKRKASKEKTAIKRRVENLRVEGMLIAEKLAKSDHRKRLKFRNINKDELSRRMSELMSTAHKLGELPAIPQAKRRFESERNLGDQRFLEIQAYVQEGTIEMILYRAAKTAQRLPGQHPTWIAALTLSSFGKKRIGSGGQLYSRTDPQSMGLLFMTSAFDSTGPWTTRDSMLIALEDRLLSYAHERHTIVFLHRIRFRNQRLKANTPR